MSSPRASALGDGGSRREGVAASRRVAPSTKTSHPPGREFASPRPARTRTKGRSSSAAPVLPPPRRARGERRILVLVLCFAAAACALPLSRPPRAAAPRLGRDRDEVDEPVVPREPPVVRRRGRRVGRDRARRRRLRAEELGAVREVVAALVVALNDTSAEQPAAVEISDNRLSSDRGARKRRVRNGLDLRLHTFVRAAASSPDTRWDPIAERAGVGRASSTDDSTATANAPCEIMYGTYAE